MRNLKKLLALTLVLAFVVSIALPAMARDISEFPDADLTEEYLAGKGNLRGAYENAAQLMVDLEVVQGHTGATADRGLDLAGKLTRGQFAALLYRAVTGGDDIPAWLVNADPFFGDTPVGSWFTPYATWMGVRGISDGMSYNVNGKPAFEPDTPINFSMAALLCMRALGFEDDKEGFTYSEVAALMVALNYGILNNVDGADEDQVDRGNAFVLIENTIRAQQFIYIAQAGSVIATWARQGNGKTFLKDAFNINEGAFTVLSDGAWFNVASEDIGFLTNTASSVWIEAKYPIPGNQFEYEQYEIGGDAAAKLGIDMYDVGRNVTIFYRTPADRGPYEGVITSVIGNLRYNDVMADWDGGLGADWAGEDFAGMVRRAIGSARAFTDNTLLYINYNQFTVLGNAYAGNNLKQPAGSAARAYPALFNVFVTNDINIDNYDGAEWVWQNVNNEFKNLGGIHSLFGATNIRVLADARNVKAVFIEYYTYTRFDKFDDNKFVTHGGGYDDILEDVQRRDIRGASTLTAGDRFFAFEIGGKFGVRKVDLTVVEGNATRFHANDSYVVVGGNNYWLAPFPGINPAGVPWDATIVSGATRILYLYLGDIVEIGGPDAAPDQYAVIIAVGATVDIWQQGGPPHYFIEARVLLEDGEEIERRVRINWSSNSTDNVSEWTDLVGHLVTYSIESWGANNINFGLPPNLANDESFDLGTNGFSRIPADAIGGTRTGFLGADSPIFVETSSGWNVYTLATVPGFNLTSSTVMSFLGDNMSANTVRVNAIAVAGDATITGATNWAISTGVNMWDRNEFGDNERRHGLFVVFADGTTGWLYRDSGNWEEGYIEPGSIFSYELRNGRAWPGSLQNTPATMAFMETASFVVLGEVNAVNVAEGFFEHAWGNTNIHGNQKVTTFGNATLTMINGSGSKRTTPAEIRSTFITDNNNDCYAVVFQTTAGVWHYVFISGAGNAPSTTLEFSDIVFGSITFSKADPAGTKIDLITAEEVIVGGTGYFVANEGWDAGDEFGAIGTRSIYTIVLHAEDGYFFDTPEFFKGSYFRNALGNPEEFDIWVNRDGDSYHDSGGTELVIEVHVFITTDRKLTDINLGSSLPTGTKPKEGEALTGVIANPADVIIAGTGYAVTSAGWLPAAVDGTDFDAVDEATFRIVLTAAAGYYWDINTITDSALQTALEGSASAHVTVSFEITPDDKIEKDEGSAEINWLPQILTIDLVFDVDAA